MTTFSDYAHTHQCAVIHDTSPPHSATVTYQLPDGPMWLNMLLSGWK